MIYQYRCPDGHIFEEEQAMVEDLPAWLSCIVCHKTSHLIVTGGSGFILRGGNWPGKEIKQGGKND